MCALVSVRFSHLAYLTFFFCVCGVPLSVIYCTSKSASVSACVPCACACACVYTCAYVCVCAYVRVAWCELRQMECSVGGKGHGTIYGHAHLCTPASLPQKCDATSTSSGTSRRSTLSLFVKFPREICSCPPPSPYPPTTTIQRRQTPE